MNNTVKEINGHHIYSPSALERRMLCPASARMEMQYPEEIGDKSDSEEGRLLHESVASILKDKIGSNDNNNSITNLSNEQQECVDKCVNFALSKYNPQTDKIYIEEKLSLIGSNFQEITNGTPDVVIVKPDRCIVIDWKFGRNKVEDAIENIQLACYSAMAMQRHNKKQCKVIIFQPRLHDMTEYTFSNPVGIIKKIEKIIADCESENAECIPGDRQCKYCSAALNCEAYTERLNNMAKKEDGTLVKKLDFLPEKRLSELYHNWKIVKKLGEKLEWKIKQVCLSKKANGQEPICGNLKIETKPGNREIKEPVKAYQIVSQYITQEDFLQAVTLSVSKLEAIVIDKIYQKAKEEGHKVTKKQIKEELKGVLNPIITRKADKLNIVHITEK